MMYWIKEWNDIIRNVFFKDEELKRLMNVPPNVKILDFIDNYFVRLGNTGKLLTNQTVRIVYNSVTRGETNTPHVLSQMMCFDIYVKTTELHNSEIDRLEMRTELIAERIKQLLMSSRYVKNKYCYRFWVRNESDMYTSVYEYNRYNLTLNYMKTI